ncbi:MAG: IS1 family transposase [Planctomycetaceae bacterium]|nr:IS1 family transposase [Planctomycetaceae bacterium]
MNSPCCHTDARPHGRDRKGVRRFRCANCRKTFQAPKSRPIGAMRIEVAKAEKVVQALLEGCSIRSVERMFDIHRDTVMALVLELGDRCKRYFFDTLKGLDADVIECDEVWSWAGCKERTRERLGKGEEYGDVWFHTAIDPGTKLLACWHAGRRSDEDTHAFAYKLAEAVSGSVMVSTDGLSNYRTALPMAFGTRVHHAAVIKTYAGGNEDHKYSPSRISGVEKHARYGNPDLSRASTSIIERSNLTLRTNLRRFTRLTIGFSKSRRHHEAMFAIWALWYNFVKPHLTLKRDTPAMAHGLTDHRWTIREMLNETAHSF